MMRRRIAGRAHLGRLDGSVERRTLVRMIRRAISGNVIRGVFRRFGMPDLGRTTV